MKMGCLDSDTNINNNNNSKINYLRIPIGFFEEDDENPFLNCKTRMDRSTHTHTHTHTHILKKLTILISG